MDQATELYPGDGKPAIAMHWLSSICNAIAPHLEVIPPVFHGISPYLPISPHISPYLPNISPYLPISPHISRPSSTLTLSQSLKHYQTDPR